MGGQQVKKEIIVLAQYLPSIRDLDTATFLSDFQERINFIDALSRKCREVRQELTNFCFDQVSELDQGIMHRAARHKPLGYPGDYLVIDWIYTRKISIGGIGRTFDELFHAYEASQAVRNRKSFFVELIRRENRPGLAVLNLASGPCRDLLETFSCLNGDAMGLLCHCVDLDRNALAYGRKLLNPLQQRVAFHWEEANVCKFRPQRLYDLIWSAGLFDYLEDRWAAALIKRMWSWCRPGGKIVFGNFHPRNPTRLIMEWIGKWFLIHRTEDQLLNLCQQAGIARELVTFEQEPLGINVFCLAKKEK